MIGESINSGSLHHPEPFAIVGISFKGPQEAIGETGLWEVLETRKNLMTEWPEDRTNVDCLHDRGPKKPNTVCRFCFSSILVPCAGDAFASWEIWVR
jgi:hypothetical protein